MKPKSIDKILNDFLTEYNNVDWAKLTDRVHDTKVPIVYTVHRKQILKVKQQISELLMDCMFYKNDFMGITHTLKELKRAGIECKKEGR